MQHHLLASPDGWSSNKSVVFSGVSLWIGLIFLVSILKHYIISSGRFFIQVPTYEINGLQGGLLFLLQLFGE
jgi:hypothetical protein